MQEKQIIIMDQGKFKLIASSRMATCYHPTPEGMGIRAGISINISGKISERFAVE